MKKTLIKNLLTAASVVYIAIMLIFDTQNISQTIIKCISNCLNTLIPSMFGYMVLTDFMIRSALGGYIFYPVYRISLMYKIADLNVFTVFMLSQIGGYPVGVRMLDILISENKNYSEIYKDMTLFCYSSGPAFIFGIIGTNVYNDAMCGFYIFISCFVSNFILFLFFSRNKKFFVSCDHKNTINTSLQNCSEALISSAKALFTVCVCMISFNAFGELFSVFLSRISLPTQAANFISCILEITNIKYFSPSFPICLCAFLCSFGGFCVIFQIYTLSKGKLPIGHFLIMRSISGLLSCLICYILTFDYEYNIETANVFETQILSNTGSGDPLSALCLIIMTIFVITLLDDLPKFKKNKKIFKKQ